MEKWSGSVCSMTKILTHKSIVQYAIFGLPLGFIGLPLYVHLPKYYADTIPSSLAFIGAIMFFGRILDCLADPWIGYLADRWPHRRQGLMMTACATLAVGVCGLFQIPQLAPPGIEWLWIAALLTLTYLSYSTLMIYFYAAGLGLAQNTLETTKLSAWREGTIVVGVLLSSSLPPLLTIWVSEVFAYQLYSFLFVLILIIAATITLRHLPKMRLHNPAIAPWQILLRNPSLRWIFALFFLNAIPPSITATLFLFYVSDILHMSTWSGAFLVLYFVSAIFSMAGWTHASVRFGKRRALMVAMGMAIGSFVWAYVLGANDAFPFVVVCILSGMALGGDLSIIPSLLADAVGEQKASGGLEFGIWNFISKFTLALAAGIGLPLLNYLGYTPGGLGGLGLTALSFSYALLPCIFKCAALALLTISPIAKKTNVL